MIYDSPRSYQPDIASPIGTVELSDSIIRRGAKVGNTVYTVPKLVDREIILPISQLPQVQYKDTVLLFTPQSTADTAWASANKGYTTLILGSQLFEQDFQYQTNLRVIDSPDTILYKSVNVFLNVEGEFLPPKKIDVLHSARGTGWFHTAQLYDVIVFDSDFDFQISDYPGMFSVLIGTGQRYPGNVRLPGLEMPNVTSNIFEQKRQQLAQRLLSS